MFPYTVRKAHTPRQRAGRAVSIWTLRGIMGEGKLERATDRLTSTIMAAVRGVVDRRLAALLPMRCR